MIPNHIHFIFFGFTEFQYIHYLAITSAKNVHNPDTIFLYYHQEPLNNPHWDRIKPLVKLIKTDPPTEFMGVELTSYQYKADILRLQKLIELGGIYLDIDIISLKPFNDLLHHSCVLGFESGSDDIDSAESITNAVILTEPNHPFICDWLEKTGKNLVDKNWAYHAVNLPVEMLRQKKYDVHLEPRQSFMPFGWRERWIFESDYSKDLKDSYTIHLWETIWNDDLKQIDNNYLSSHKNLFTELFKKYKDAPKMKIAVYAISKNEEQFVKRFCDSSKDADIILIADTGSTDRTVELARECGATVHDIFVSPWRFDKARDTALALLPADVDVCISLDLDEELQPGWREEIERVWTKDTTRLRYKFDWGVGIIFYYEKIHHRKGYHWHHPCHEYPRADSRINEVWAQTDMLLAIHKPDPTKSRGQYLDLLHLAVTEDPYCPRNAFYYARELTFSHRWLDATVALHRYLQMPNATWSTERCYAMRIMARCYNELNQDGKLWLQKACKEAPNTREPWVELAELCHNRKEWHECYTSAKIALEIKDKALVYTMDPSVWGSKPHDYLALAAYNLGLHEEAVEQGQIAVNLSPEDMRLQGNLKYYLEKQ
jgi:hypothetical protein